MARKRKEPIVLENVTITDVAAEGKALARVDDMVVFVPYVVPGDVVDLRVQRKKHRYIFKSKATVKSNLMEFWVEVNRAFRKSGSWRSYLIFDNSDGYQFTRFTVFTLLFDS